MGIYPENDVYGIRWFLIDNEGRQHNMFERSYDSIMTPIQMDECKRAYIGLLENDVGYNGDIVFQVLVNVWSTLDYPPSSSKSWYTIRDKMPWEDGFNVV